MKNTILRLVTLVLTLALSCAPALAAESEADTLLLQELTEWASRYHARALAEKPLAEPTLTEDGYEFIYEFATFYAEEPVMSADTAINAIVLTSAAEAGPRGTAVDNPLSVILAAYYQENPDLRGSRDNAVLYSIDLLPESLQWAQVQRDGQRVQTVQYAVHEQMTTGGDGYTDAGVIYTLEEGIVGAIRVYGLSGRITEGQVYDVLTVLRDAALADEYAQVPFSYDGASLEKFGGEDLAFSGLDFAGMTAEDAEKALGEAIDDVWMEDGEGFIRTMTFAECEVTFLYDASKANCQVYMMMLTGDGVEGPRAVRLGDTFASVFNRFRNGEGEFDGAAEVLYGEEANGEFGIAQYGTDGSAQLRYGLVLEDGTKVVLQMHFTLMQLDEVMIYIN